jgi:hypothetical protein
MSETRENVKRQIRVRFYSHVAGRFPDLKNYNLKHDGAEGDWLTKAMGLKVNGKNEPDFNGFEMKKDSAKTTFGDWSPDIGLYKRNPTGSPPEMGRTEFLIAFGVPRFKENKVRHSWSGGVFPNVKGFNEFGQVMSVDSTDSVIAEYNYAKDCRQNKIDLVPSRYRNETIVLVKWSAQKLKLKLEKKFNNLGWFKCLKDISGKYSKLQFGYPINFSVFIALVKTGEIFCDSGMISTNQRPYMSWRASKTIWESLAETE